MIEQNVLVEMKLYESGSLKAFVDVTIPSELGELTLRGFRVVQQDTAPAWVAFPNSRYTNKDGKLITAQILETSKTVKRRLADLILDEYRRKTENTPS